MIYIIGIATFLLSMLAQWRLKSKFKKYSKIPLQSNLSGKEIAEMMLRDNNIIDVQVLSVPGKLTDHYNPTNKTVNLSPEVYSGRNAAAAAVSSHECGHAVQHATAYSMLTLRSSLVPIQNMSGKILNVVVLAAVFGGSFLYSVFPFQGVIMLIIALYSVLTLFSVVTLPVEFDASKRALDWISERKIFEREEHTMAKDALFWAAMTYVVAAIGSIATLLYYVSMLTGRD